MEVLQSHNSNILNLGPPQLRVEERRPGKLYTGFSLFELIGDTQLYLQPTVE
jgi:hypothetical protein